MHEWCVKNFSAAWETHFLFDWCGGTHWPCDRRAWGRSRSRRQTIHFYTASQNQGIPAGPLLVKAGYLLPFQMKNRLARLRLCHTGRYPAPVKQPFPYSLVQCIPFLRGNGFICRCNSVEQLPQFLIKQCVPHGKMFTTNKLCATVLAADRSW